jgi:hypothetical protein
MQRRRLRPAIRYQGCSQRCYWLLQSNSEGESEVSIAIGANVLRLVGDKGVRVRDLPRTGGVSKEAIATALSFLQKRGYAGVETEATTRFKRVVLTTKGRSARDRYYTLVGTIEENWRNRLREDVISALRFALERLDHDGPESPLFRGLNPPSGGWRASLPKPIALPDYPMVLHRGGYPDGS